MSSVGAKARGFPMMVVMPVVVLLGLLATVTSHLALDQRHRTSLMADRASARYGAEMALNAAECELFAATETLTDPEYIAALPRERIAVLEPGSRRGFLMGACGSDISFGLCQPQPDQSLWMLARLPDTITLAVETDVRLPGALRIAGRTMRCVIEPVPDRWHGQTRHSDDTPPLWLYRITAAEFGADPAASVVLQTVFRFRVPCHTLTSQAITEAALPTIRSSGTATQRVYITSDQHDTTAPHLQTLMLGRLNWRELIEEGLR